MYKMETPYGRLPMHSIKLVRKMKAYKNYYNRTLSRDKSEYYLRIECKIVLYHITMIQVARTVLILRTEVNNAGRSDVIR